MSNELYHYGVKGQVHGIRNGPPYPLYRQDKFKDKSSYKKNQEKKLKNASSNKTGSNYTTHDGSPLASTKSKGHSKETGKSLANAIRSAKLNHIDRNLSRSKMSVEEAKEDKDLYSKKAKGEKSKFKQKKYTNKATGAEKDVTHYTEKYNKEKEKIEKLLKKYEEKGLDVRSRAKQRELVSHRSDRKATMELLVSSLLMNPTSSTLLYSSRMGANSRKVTGKKYTVRKKKK